MAEMEIPALLDPRDCRDRGYDSIANGGVCSRIRFEGCQTTNRNVWGEGGGASVRRKLIPVVNIWNRKPQRVAVGNVH